MIWLIAGALAFLAGLGWSYVAYPNTSAPGFTPILGPVLMIGGWTVLLYGLANG